MFIRDFNSCSIYRRRSIQKFINESCQGRWCRPYLWYCYYSCSSFFWLFASLYSFVLFWLLSNSTFSCFSCLNFFYLYSSFYSSSPSPNPLLSHLCSPTSSCKVAVTLKFIFLDLLTFPLLLASIQLSILLLLLVVSPLPAMWPCIAMRPLECFPGANRLRPLTESLDRPSLFYTKAASAKSSNSLLHTSHLGLFTHDQNYPPNCLLNITAHVAGLQHPPGTLQVLLEATGGWELSLVSELRGNRMEHLPTAVTSSNSNTLKRTTIRRLQNELLALETEQVWSR